MTDVLKHFQEVQAREKYLRERDYDDELNSRLVVRCNDELKAAFELVCKRGGRKPSTAVRDFMLSCVRKGGQLPN